MGFLSNIKAGNEGAARYKYPTQYMQNIAGGIGWIYSIPGT